MVVPDMRWPKDDERRESTQGPRAPVTAGRIHAVGDVGHFVHPSDGIPPQGHPGADPTSLSAQGNPASARRPGRMRHGRAGSPILGPAMERVGQEGA